MKKRNQKKLNLKIEKRIPLSRAHKQGTIWQQIYSTLLKMEVGDSFVLSRHLYTSFWTMKFKREFDDAYFTTRKIDDHTVRVFKIK